MRMSLPTLQVLGLFASGSREQRSGYEIASALKLGSGTLYPILARLETHGVLESEWEDVDPSQAGRPRRRYYRLTPYGAVFADEQMRALDQVRSGTSEGTAGPVTSGGKGWRGPSYAG